MLFALGWLNWPNTNMIDQFKNNSSYSVVYDINNERNDYVNRIYTIPFFELKNSVTKECINLTKPLMFKIEVNKEGFYYTNEEYNIYAYGETQKEAEIDVLEEFKIQYKSYALEDDINLDKKAKILKKKLLDICGDIDA